MIKRVLLTVGVLCTLNGGWLDDITKGSSDLEDDIYTEELITPDENIDVQVQNTDTDIETIDDAQGWAESFSSNKVAQKAVKNYFIGLTNGNTYGEYYIDILYQRGIVKRLYEKNGYNYYWFKDNFKINKKIQKLIDAIELASSEALDDLERYHYNEIINQVNRAREKSFNEEESSLFFTQLDILLTDAFLNLAHDLHNGTLNYQDFQARIKAKKEETDIKYKWSTPKNEPNYFRLFENAMTQNNIKDILYSLVNHNLIYERLKEAYEKYKSIRDSGGWVRIPKGRVLRYGSKGPRVNLLARRLAITGDLKNYNGEYKVFDKRLKLALKHYQKRMGLWESGTLTPETRRNLNISAAAKVKLIKLNIEKSRWETNSMRNRFILVNIPDFMLRIYDHGKLLLRNRVIVGKKTNPTPIFSSVMSYVVLNPTWTVPDSIVKKEMLPKLKKDPGYLTNKFTIYDGWGKNRQPIDPYNIDWSKYDENSKIPYVFVQKPGKKNPLGIMKFMFPNNNDVYIHDTPTKSLFKKRFRAYSHGCVRLHRPDTLLKFLSNQHMTKGYSKIRTLLNTGKNKSIGLNRKIPVFIRYYTVFVDEDDTIKFLPDLYGYDKLLIDWIL